MDYKMIDNTKVFILEDGQEYWNGHYGSMDIFNIHGLDGHNWRLQVLKNNKEDITGFWIVFIERCTVPYNQYIKISRDLWDELFNDYIHDSQPYEKLTKKLFSIFSAAGGKLQIK